MLSVSARGALHERYDWLDQARGLIVLMLLISSATDKFDGNVLTGDIPLGPPMLNHGYDYFDGTPSIITFIDTGQGLFMFVLGFVGYGALTSRWKKRGAGAALGYLLRRVGVLYALEFGDAGILNYLQYGDINWRDFLYNDTFAMLALGTLAGLSSVMLIRQADRRIAFSVALTLVHSLLYTLPIFNHHGPTDDIFNLYTFPFGVLGTCAVAIAGTCFGQWYAIDSEEPLSGFRARIAPVAVLAVVAAYCVDWIQPAQHHDQTASMQFQAIGIGGLMLMMFYSFGRMGFRLPILSSLGRNLLLLFAVGGLSIQVYFAFLPKALLLQWPLLAMVLVGILPLVALSWLAAWLDKRGIMVRA